MPNNSCKGFFVFLSVHLFTKLKPAISITEIITIDQDILGGQTVFKGTRVPIESLFDHLEARVMLDEFLDDFPTVTKAQAVALLDCANRLLNAKHIDQLYAAVA